MSDPAPCKRSPGLFMPVINRSRCEGKADRVRGCPYQVFEIRPLTPELKGDLPLLARIRALVHGNRQAFAASAGSCHACGRCVAAWPEDAITLTRSLSPALGS